MSPQAAKDAAEPKKPYHHGDLRRALLDASLEMLNEPGGASLLTLREVARRAGVSHAAPYRHFPSKEALLAEVAEEGFRQLREDMLKRAAPVEGEPLRRHEAIGVAYVLFAAAHPAHYRVMFGAQLPFDSAAGLATTAKSAFEVLVESVVRCQKAGLMAPGSPMEAAVSSWSLVHGLAQLVIDGRLVPTGYSSANAEQLAELTLRNLTRGLSTRPVGG